MAQNAKFLFPKKYDFPISLQTGKHFGKTVKGDVLEDTENWGQGFRMGDDFCYPA